MSPRALVLALGLLALRSSTLEAQSGGPGPRLPDDPTEWVTGRTAEVRVDGRSVKGELLAVSADSLWLLTGPTVRAVLLAPLRSVRVIRHSVSGSKVALWGALGALVTGVGLTGACSSVANAECGGVLPGMILGWGVWTGLFGTALAQSSREDLPPAQPSLSGYARFPQGLPAGFAPEPR